jgi:hypothetical protein
MKLSRLEITCTGSYKLAHYFSTLFQTPSMYYESTMVVKEMTMETRLQYSLITQSWPKSQLSGCVPGIAIEHLTIIDVDITMVVRELLRRLASNLWQTSYVSPE